MSRALFSPAPFFLWAFITTTHVLVSAASIYAFIEINWQFPVVAGVIVNPASEKLVISNAGV